MTIRIKVDEDLSQRIANIFVEHGYDAISILEQGWQGLPDDELSMRIQNEERWLVTADKGFADLRSHSPGTHAGVLLFRLDEECLRGYMKLAQVALQQLDLERLAGAVIVVTPRGIRTRKPSS